MQQKQQRPTAIVSVYAPSDIEGLERWEAHLRPLKQAGTVSIWSVRHLQPGTDRLKHLYHHLDHADLIILLLSADFFTDDECEALMEYALERHQQRTVRVVPLLLRPFAFRETKLATFTPFPSDGRPVVLWENTESAFDDCVRGLRHILGRPITKPLRFRNKRSSIEEQNRVRMRERLRRTYEEIFTQSLQGIMRIELSLSDKPDAVQNAATLLFQTPTRPDQLLPPGTSILDIYDEATHDLLILGAPGAGKSTLLIELARQLVVRAEADETHPLPVLLPLSSWASKRPRLPLHLWLAEQAAQFYDIPKDLAGHWIDEDQLLPLLDGLDEMEEAARPACISAINTYHRDHLRTPLVVCSRQAEYEGASKSQRLTLQNAVVIQPLTHEHVQVYLAQMGKSLAVLRHVLTINPALAKIATTPLMVHILILTYQGITMQQLSMQREELQQQIWADYVQRMIERKKGAKHYPAHQTITWLARLARSASTIIMTNQIFPGQLQQPFMLPERQRGFYHWSIRLITWLFLELVFGLSFGLISGLFLELVNRLSIGLFFNLVFGLLGGLFFGLKMSIGSVGVLSWSSPNRKFGILVALSSTLPSEIDFTIHFSLFDSLVGGMVSGLSVGLFVGPVFGPLNGLVFGLLGGLVFGLLGGFDEEQLTARHRVILHPPNVIVEGMRRSVKNELVGVLLSGLFLGLVSGLLSGLFFGLVSGLLSGLFFGLASGFVFGFLFGLSFELLFILLFRLGTAIQDYTLRFWLWQTHTSPWSMQKFLDDAVTCILLRRIGNSYSFIHRLLLDYFASLSTGPTPTSVTVSHAPANPPPTSNSSP